MIAAVALTPERDLVVLDLVRDRMTPYRHFEAVRPMFERWHAHTLFVEESMATITLAHDASRAEIPITPLNADKDKLTRALPAAARMEQGRVWITAGAPWAQAFLDELAAFPYAGAHDDMCDVLGYAARIDAAHYLPPSPQDEIETRWLAPEDRAIAAALGLDPYEEIDWMTVPW